MKKSQPKNTGSTTKQPQRSAERDAPVRTDRGSTIYPGEDAFLRDLLRIKKLDER